MHAERTLLYWMAIPAKEGVFFKRYSETRFPCLIELLLHNWWEDHLNVQQGFFLQKSAFPPPPSLEFLLNCFFFSCSTVAPPHRLGLLYKAKSTGKWRSVGFYHFSILFGAYTELLREPMKHSKLWFFQYADNTLPSFSCLLSQLKSVPVFKGYSISRHTHVKHNPN